MTDALAALTQLMVEEVSLCQRGKNPGAQVLLVKSEDDDVNQATQVFKALFDDVLEQMKFRQEARELTEPIWDLISLLTMSFTQILADDARYPNKRDAMLQSVQQMADYIKNTIGMIVNKNKESDAMEQKEHDEIVKAKDQEIAKLTLMATLTDAEKAHFNGLDEKGRETFLAKSQDDRLAIIEKARAADETLTVDGITITKSEVGAGPFALLKKQAARTAELEKASQLLTYTRKAEKELPNLPGTTEEKAAVLCAVDTITDETTRQNLYGILTKCDEAIKVGVFKELGTNEPDSVDVQLHDVNTPEGAGEQLNALAKAVEEEQGISFAKAYDVVLSTKEGAALYGVYKGAERFRKAGGAK